MGGCGSKEGKEMAQRSREIERQLNADKKAKANMIKLLLLGAGECGKSTVLKQMQILHSNGFTEDEINEKKAIIFGNTVSSMCTILKAMDTILKLQIDPIREDDKSMVYKVQEMGQEAEPITLELAQALQRLWDDPGVKKGYEMRAEYQLTDSAKYFLDNVIRISEAGYRPSEQDILFSRAATTGVVEVKFKIKDLDFRVFDVGGQRSERRKWIHCFDNVEAIIFITAISEYDQVLFEDENTNRMIESMQLFNSICNSTWFLNTAMILFLNKKDLFSEKIKRVNITSAFPDYEGGQNYEEAVNYIKMKFAELNMNPDKKNIYMHETCATDTNQVQLVISSVIDTIIQKNLQKAGMM
ncbi:unnamed protein product, partial [Mesorhabditis belari]|uniref:Uncharacterized protein n=1 Tax=Mesorhabditis belari TaxID=2138241 RepID=A0AAF3EMH5_9BILA